MAIEFCDELGIKNIRKEIPVDEISFKEKEPVGLGMRAKKYAELIQKGVDLPPIQVFGKRFKGDTYQVFDGHARVEAYKKLGIEKIDAVVVAVDDKGRPIKC